jgi:hypothetical protein
MTIDRRRGIRLLYVALAILLFLFLLSGMISFIVLPVEILFHFLFGWLFFLRDVGPSVRLFWPSIITGIIAFFFVLVGAHSAIKWCRGAGQPGDSKSGGTWKSRWSVAAVLLIVMAFVAGICMTGLVHQLYWFSRDGSPVRTFRVYAMERACVNNLRIIDAAKVLAARDNRWPSGSDCDSATNRAVINAFIKGNTTPQCPEGGTYTYNPVGTNPVCSIAGPAPHVMP